jgi:hypothetical protein
MRDNYSFTMFVYTAKKKEVLLVVLFMTIHIGCFLIKPLILKATSKFKNLSNGNCAIYRPYNISENKIQQNKLTL